MSKNVKQWVWSDGEIPGSVIESLMPPALKWLQDKAISWMQQHEARSTEVVLAGREVIVALKSRTLDRTGNDRFVGVRLSLPYEIFTGQKPEEKVHVYWQDLLSRLQSDMYRTSQEGA